MMKNDYVSWAKYRSSRDIVNVALRKAKSALKTVKDILGRKQRADDVKEIKINNHHKKKNCGKIQ